MDFDLQPRLLGERLELRPLVTADFDALLEAAGDPLIWEQHPEPDRHRPEAFRRYFDGAIESRGAFAILERRSGRVIGSSRYCNLKPEASEVEIGWTFLERAFWGGVYNGELKTLMIDHALRFVDHVVFVVGRENLRSQMALRKIGATLIDRPPAPEPDGAAIEKVVFSIARDRWRREG